MNYKNLFFITLLLPIFCHSQTKSDRIKAVKKLHREKLLEVTQIEKQIATVCELVDYFRNNYTAQLHYALRRKLRTLKDSDADEKQIKQKIMIRL